jgi:5'-3' exonuclease
MKPYRRSLIYPEYKQLRKKNADDELLKAFNQSQSLILDLMQDVLGFPIMAEDGFESDDCIGWLVHRHRHRYDLIYAASNDSDLYQLFWCDRFRVLQKDINDVMDGTRLMKQFNMTPEQFMLASALQGTHNDIAGIVGVGPKKALDAIRMPNLMRAYREKHGDLIDRNMKLIKLPHPEFPNARIPTQALRFDHRALYRWCGRLDIDVTQSMLTSFEQVSQ